MKTIIFYLALSTLVSCAQPSANQEVSSVTQDSSLVVTVKPSRETCLRLDSERNTDFMIVMGSVFYLVRNQEVFLSDFKDINKLYTEIVALGGYCTLDVVNGQLRSITLPEQPTCGGMFQAECPKPQPTPYVCGPQGQICY